MTLEEAQEQILTLTDELNKLKEDYKTLEGENSQNKEKIRSLQDHNHSLFLRLTEPVAKKEEATPPPTYEDIAKTYKGVIN